MKRIIILLMSIMLLIVGCNKEEKKVTEVIKPLDSEITTKGIFINKLSDKTVELKTENNIVYKYEDNLKSIIDTLKEGQEVEITYKNSDEPSLINIIPNNVEESYQGIVVTLDNNEIILSSDEFEERKFTYKEDLKNLLLGVKQEDEVIVTYIAKNEKNEIVNLIKIDASSINTDNVILPTKDIQVKIENEKELFQGNVYISPLGFKMYNLPEYIGGSESVNKDFIMSRENSQKYVQIEKLKVSGKNYKDTLVNSLSKSFAYEDLLNKTDDEFLKSLDLYIVYKSKNMPITYLIYTVKNQSFLITIMLDKYNNEYEKILAGIKTIELL